MEAVIKTEANRTINDVISYVLIHCNVEIKELLGLATVNRAFRKAVDNPLLWQLIAAENGMVRSVAASIELPVKNDDIKYRVLNTLLLTPQLVSLRKKSQKHASKQIQFCLSKNGGEMLPLMCAACIGGCCIEGAGAACAYCCFKGSACATLRPCFMALYPSCFGLACKVGESGVLGHLACFIGLPCLCVVATVSISSYADYRMKREHEEIKYQLTEKINAIESLINQHGIFQNAPQSIAIDDSESHYLPELLIMSDNELVPLLEMRSNGRLKMS